MFVSKPFDHRYHENKISKRDFFATPFIDTRLHNVILYDEMVTSINTILYNQIVTCMNTILYNEMVTIINTILYNEMVVVAGWYSTVLQEVLG